MDQFLALLLGFIASHLHGAAGVKLPSKLNFAISLIACGACGLLSTGYQLFTSGQFSWATLLGNIGIAFAASQTWYNLYFKKKDQSNSLPPNAP